MKRTARIETRWFLVLLALLTLCALPACSDDTDEDTDDNLTDGDETDDDDDDDDNDDDTDGDDGDGDDTDGDEPEPFTLPESWLSQTATWTDCDLYVDLPQGVTQKQAQCTEVQVPLFWDDPDNGETITLTVKRLLAPTQPAKRQIWLLEGGPGGSSIADFPDMMDNFQSVTPDSDTYAIDHRGVGLSTRMGCPAEDEDSEDGRQISEAEWPGCLEYLENEWHDLAGFNVTNAAIDVGYMAELSREANKDIFVYGVSYGSYWGHRYAQIFPTQSRGIILDSVAPSDPGFLDQFDIQGNRTMHQFFDRCADDAFCREKLGETPYETALAALHRFRDENHCSVLQTNYGIIAEYIQIAAFSVGQSWYGRSLVPPLFYRLARCDDADVQAIVNMVYTALGVGETEPSNSSLANSYLLGVHIGTSEMISEPAPTVEEIQQAYDESLIQLGVGRRMVTRYHAGWPNYEHDRYVHEWADADTPLLMMNGTLDLQTPIEIATVAKDRLTGPRQYFITVPDANHCVLYASPTNDDSGLNCGMSLLLSYMDNPDASPDTSCLDHLLIPDYQGYAPYTNYYFHTPDLWENTPATLDCALPEGFLNNENESFNAFIARGVQRAEWLPGNGAYTLQVSGTELDVDSYAIVIHPATSQDSTELVSVDSYGNARQLGSNHTGYRASQTVVSKGALAALKTSGENLLVYNAEHPVLHQYVADMEEKTSGSDSYLKFCPLAVIDGTSDQNALYVCHDQNTDFGVGEEIQLAGNIDLTTDANALAATFQIQGPCQCSKNGVEEIDCETFENLTPTGRKIAGFRSTIPTPPGLPSPKAEPDYLGKRAPKLPMPELNIH